MTHRLFEVDDAQPYANDDSDGRTGGYAGFGLPGRYITPPAQRLEGDGEAGQHQFHLTHAQDVGIGKGQLSL
jgi:hypothetical protein